MFNIKWNSMSQTLISRNKDLLRLQREDFAIEECEGWLVTHRIPYVDESRNIKEGTLYIKLDLNGQGFTTKPSNHVAYWKGKWPCNQDGSHMQSLVYGNAKQEYGLCYGEKSDYMFSFMQSKETYPPDGNYPTFYEFVKDHVQYISAPAFSLDKPTARDIKDRPFYVEDRASVLRYPDTNSSRANITNMNQVFCDKKVAIIGLGGTGSYILDKLAKMPLKEIHLIDGDSFELNNVFRAPGTPSDDDLTERISKVSYFSRKYGRMHKAIIPHDCMLNSTNLGILDGMDFVFMSIDAVKPKNMIARYLISKEIPFIDSGLGIITNKDGSLGGSVRITTATPDKNDHLKDIFGDGSVDDDLYHSNIQITVLNSLAADLSVIKWLKMMGYLSSSNEFTSVFDIEFNKIFNE